MLVLLYGWGDLAAARDFAATIPSKLLLEDVFITHVTTLWLQSGDYEKALQTLGRSQREMLQEALVELPTALLRGDVHAAAGRRAAAEIQWREAMKTVDRLLETKPDSARLHEQKAVLLASLGDRPAAAAEYGLARELNRNPAAGSIAWARSYEYHRLAGDDEGAIVRLDRLVSRDYRALALHLQPPALRSGPACPSPRPPREGHAGAGRPLARREEGGGQALKGRAPLRCSSASSPGSASPAPGCTGRARGPCSCASSISFTRSG